MTLDLKKAASMITPFFTVRQSGIQGKGAFATKKIRKGQRLIEYVGEHISDKEADDRYDEAKMKRHHTFLFTLNSKIVVDGAVGGNASIYINHSCEPNCEAVIEKNHIWVYSLRTIHPGEELVYDYQYELDDESDEMIDFYKCLCGAETCRGTIMKLSKKTQMRRKKDAERQAKKATKKAAKTSKKAGSKKSSKTGSRKTSKKTSQPKSQRSTKQTRKKSVQKKSGASKSKTTKRTRSVR